MRFIVALCLAMFVATPALADAGPDAVVAADHGSASTVAPSVTVNAGSGAVIVVEPPKPLPDPAAEPAESASTVWKLYKAGHVVPAIIVLAFFLLMLAQRWVAWLRTGYRKLAVASVLAGLAMIAERAAAGTSPSLPMLMGAIGAAFALYVKGGEAKTPAVE